LFSALNNDGVWSDGLLAFYEIFKFLEENVSAIILPVEFHRTSQFEKDLEFFKGRDWQKTYKIRPSVQKYLNHLYEVSEKNPLLLIAYVYHMYMGLLSGGQILSKQRKIASKFKFMNRFREQKEETDEVQPGTHLTYFPDKSIFELKNNMRHNIDAYTKDFDEKLRGELIEESKKVFELNNEVIASVEGVAAQLQRNAINFAGILLLVLLSYYIFIKMWHV
jgi:heme oxygenase 2